MSPRLIVLPIRRGASPERRTLPGEWLDARNPGVVAVRGPTRVKVEIDRANSLYVRRDAAPSWQLLDAIEAR